MATIPQKVFEYLSELENNNHREWFQANKKAYDEAKASLEVFVQELIIKISSFEPTVASVKPKDCFFRINRDVRFSKEKSPYKTNFGAIITQGGKKSIYSGYYLHIENGNSFVSGGIYMPQPNVLKAIRQEIYFHAPEFEKILNHKDFVSNFKELWGEDKLVRPPKDFPADFKQIELLKYKNYFVLHPYTNQKVCTSTFLDQATAQYKAMTPLLTFLNRAIRNMEGNEGI